MRLQPLHLLAKKRTYFTLAALLAMGTFVGARSFGDSASSAKTTNSPAAPSANTGKSYGESLSRAFRDAARQVLPSVVMITSTPHAAAVAEEQGPAAKDFEGSPFGDLFNDPQFRQFFKEFPAVPRMHPHAGHVVGMGSGVIIDPSGVILTNNHVVEGDGTVTVRLHDGREFTATQVKGDPKTDLAIVRIRGAGKLDAAQLGDSDKIEVGDWVLALGQPFGLEDTVTAGIISAKGRGIGLHRPRQLPANRRRHQPRQQRRPAGRSRRPGDRHQYRHLHTQWRRSKASASPCPSIWRNGSRTNSWRRGRSSGPTWA